MVERRLFGAGANLRLQAAQLFLGHKSFTCILSEMCSLICGSVLNILHLLHACLSGGWDPVYVALPEVKFVLTQIEAGQRVSYTIMTQIVKCDFILYK